MTRRGMPFKGNPRGSGLFGNGGTEIGGQYLLQARFLEYF